MICIRFYLDTRAAAPGSPAPLKLMVNKRGQTSLMSTGISLLPSEWDAAHQTVVLSPRRKVLNDALSRMMLRARDLVAEKVASGEFAAFSATQVRDAIKVLFAGEDARNWPLLCDLWKAYEQTLAKRNTRVLYDSTAKRINGYDHRAMKRGADYITADWVQRWRGWMEEEQYAASTIAISMTHLKAVWNFAKLPLKSPFADVKIRMPATRKRSLTLEQMRVLKNAQCKGQQAVARDFFLLSFYLGGANPQDLYDARLTDVVQGRWEYSRAKTGGQFSVKVCDEAAAIISRYKGRLRLFGNDYDSVVSLTSSFNRCLKEVCKREGLPAISLYWARHTLATLMIENHASLEVVAAALGHSTGFRTTSIYVAVRQQRIDEELRSLFDLLK